MSAIIDRRTVLALGGAVLMAPGIGRATPTDVARVYRNAIVIDGNLVAEVLNGSAVVDPADAAKVRKSGLTVMKQTLGGSGGSYAEANQDIDDVTASIDKNSDLFTNIQQVSDVAAAKSSGKVGIIYSFEAASMHEGQLDRIDHFRTRGVRVMGLSYNLASPFGTGTLVRQDKGLTPLGHEAVARMNAQRVSIDLSHSDEPTSFAALAASSRPVLITHAGSAAVHPNPRNKSDRLMRAVAEKGGVMGIYDLSYLGDYPNNPSLETYVRHLTHALNVCGEEHVGIGSDTTLLGPDTSPESVAAWSKVVDSRKAAGIAAPEEGPLPYVRGLGNQHRWEVIATELFRHHYTARTVDKVLGLNFQRVFTETW